MSSQRSHRSSAKRSWLMRGAATAVAIAALLAVATAPAQAWKARTIEGSTAERSNTTTASPPNEDQCSLGAADSRKGLFEFSWACYAHDVCYQNHQLNGIVRDRKACDSIFYAKMKAECTSRHGRFSPKRYSCLGVAKAYYLGVRLAGPLPWRSWNGRHCLTVGGQHSNGAAYVTQQRCNWGENQRFTLTPSGEVRPRQTSRKCLHISAASRNNGVSVLVYACNGQPYQRFTFTSRGALRAQHSGKCIDVQGASQSDGARVMQYTCNGRANQRFKLTSRGELRPLHR